MPQKFLVFRLSSIGDIILSSSLVKTLSENFPDSQIDFVVKKQFLSLVEHNPRISKIYTVDKAEGKQGLKALGNSLSQNNYDVFFDIHRNFRSSYIRKLTKAKKTVKFDKRVFKRTLLTSFHIDTYKDTRAIYKRFNDTASFLGVDSEIHKTEFYNSSEAELKVQNILKEKNVNPEEYVVLVPGASFSNKQWLPERFAQVAEKMLKEGYNVVVIGGKQEKEMCSDVFGSTPVLNLVGELTLLESAAVVKYAKAVISNDTGMLHLAEAQNTPVVGIYGPTANQFGFYPILEKSLAVDIKLSCRPCTKMGMNHCPKKHFRCMKDISVEMVFGALQKLLNS